MAKKARPFKQSKAMGKRLEQVRKKAGLSQKDAGLKIGVSDTAVSSWERGIFEPPLSYLVYLTEELCCDLRWLILGIEPGSQSIAGSLIDIEGGGKEAPEEREIELLRKLEIANDEARKWRLRAEELERGLGRSSGTTAMGAALNVRTQAGLSSTEYVKKIIQSSEER